MEKRPLMYCNPLSIKDIKSGRPLDSWLAQKYTPEEQKAFLKDYRSISDPSVIYYDGKWIMYPSYSQAYVSEDFVHWEYVDIGLHDLGYSPAPFFHRGKWYILGYGNPKMYRSDSPLGPFEYCGTLTYTNGEPFIVVDESFLVDGDRVYMYFFCSMSAKGKMDAEAITATGAVEMDPDEPWKVITETRILNTFDQSEPWQFYGNNNQNPRMGWIEGQWAFKIGKRYYVLYSGSGTELDTYANGIIYSDEGPLSGFRKQKNHNPLTRKTTGIIRGAGHGSVVEGPDGTHWVFYTSVFSFNHCFERRIGMDPIGVDENGELFCPETTDTPQFAPGVLPHPENGNSAGLYPLTFMTYPTATSSVYGREPIYASDDSIRTWWEPASDDKEREITFVISQGSAFSIEAYRIIWRDINMETLEGRPCGAFGYKLFYKEKADDKEWKIWLDASDNKDDLCIDFRQPPKVNARIVKLKITSAPKGITPGLVSLTVFGTCVFEGIKE